MVAARASRLGPGRGDGLPDDDGVALFVGNGHGAAGNAVHEEGLHLELGEGPPHAVGVHDGQAGLGRRDHHLHRVAAANLVGDEGGGLLAGELLYGAQGMVRLEVPHLLNAHRRRPDTAHADYPGILRNLLRRQDRNRTPPAHRLPRPQPPDVRVAAAARTQNTGANGNRLQHILGGLPHFLLIL